MKIVTIVGARPQFIKAAVLSREIQKHNDIEEVMIHTGQHYDYMLSDQFFQELSIPKPKFNLRVGSKSHAWQTGEMLGMIEDFLKLEKPDCVVVYGDTNSTLAGALAAVKMHIPVAHVEAGLRSFNRQMPEEINRIATDHICDLLFSPSQEANYNIYLEGLSDRHIYSGDITYDSFLYNFRIASETLSPFITNLDVKNFYLATIHRPSNTDNKENFKSIIDALDVLPHPVILPVHPRIKDMVSAIENDTTNIIFTKPLGYYDMLNLLFLCRKVLTDSGGLQKEAYYMKRACITLREDTEYPNTCIGNWNILTGANKIKIIEAITKSQDKSVYNVSAFGDGKAGTKILKELIKRY